MPCFHTLLFLVFFFIACENVKWALGDGMGCLLMVAHLVKSPILGHFLPVFYTLSILSLFGDDCQGLALAPLWSSNVVDEERWQVY